VVSKTDPRHRSIALVADGDQLARSRLRSALAEDGPRGVPEGHRAESAPPRPESGEGSPGPGGSSPNALRQAEMVRALSSYNYAASHPPLLSDLNRVVRDTLLLVSHELDGWPGVTASTELPGDLPPLHCDPHWVADVLLHLLIQARMATPEGGEIAIRSGYDRRTARFMLEVSHKEAGGSMPPGAEANEPNLRGAPLESADLLPSAMWRALRAHGGEIRVDRRPGGRTHVTLSLGEQPPEREPDRPSEGERARRDSIPKSGTRPRKTMSPQEAKREDSGSYARWGHGPVRPLSQ